METLKSSSETIEVIQSYYTVSGDVFSVLQCRTGMLRIGTLLSNDHLQWTIVKNNLVIGRKKDIELQERMKANFFYMYKLLPIDHTAKPSVGEILSVKNGC